ncbi:3'-5' exonuclease [Pseudodesulfovibrio karagichevae]|uniref:3'-5' exonuclease n=1 Tax=Pseudodesulfovibrio karagichevae TaxID=3239305 RepID=A0ABV4KAD0_9BACT
MTTDSLDIPQQYLRAFTKEEINEMPLRHYEGDIKVVRSDADLEEALEGMRASSLLGFDTETRPVFKKGKKPGPPSLLQLATSDCAYVFQLGVLPLAKGVCDILSNRRILKTGVAVRDDILGLQKHSRFKPSGFVDLSDITAKYNLQTHGLRNMAANLLGFRISKSAQCSNWAKDKLTRQQLVYAATDAWISRELYLALEELGLT